VFKCAGKACAPPPVGTGGSLDGPPAGFRAATEADRATIKTLTGGKTYTGAWSNVMVSTDPAGVNGCVARGFDKAGRVQSLYSAEHTAGQAAAKFARVQKLAAEVDRLDKDLVRDAMTDPAAAATLLVRRLGMRPGSTKDTGAKVDAFGASTIEARHVTINPGGKSITLDFIGKGNVRIHLNVKDPDVVAVMTKWKGDKQRRAKMFGTSATKVNEYIDSKLGDAFNAKDLRTLKATTMALEMVSQIKRKPKTEKDFKAMRLKIGKAVAAQLGNTYKMALDSYINPTVFTALGSFS